MGVVSVSGVYSIWSLGFGVQVSAIAGSRGLSEAREAVQAVSFVTLCMPKFRLTS